MSKKAQILTALLIGSMVTIGGMTTLHTTTNNTPSKITNINLLAGTSATVGQVNGLQNQSLTISPVNGKVLNGVDATITQDGKTIYSGDIYNGKINISNYFSPQVGELAGNLNKEGFQTVTLNVKGYEPVNVSMYINKLYGMEAMYTFNPNEKINTLVNGKVQNFTANKRGSVYLYSNSPFTFKPANMNDSFGRDYKQSSYLYGVAPFYAVEASPIYLKKEVKATGVLQTKGLENQSLTISPVNGKVLNNIDATITEDGKTIYSGGIYNGKINISNINAPEVGPLIGNLNKDGFHNVTLTVKGYKPVVVTLYSRKMYGMEAMYSLNPNQKVNSLINGQVQDFTANKNGSLYLYSYKPFTFKPANMNDSFGRDYNQSSYLYGVSPFYAVEASPIYLTK